MFPRCPIFLWRFLRDKVDPSSSAFETPQYVTNYNLFVCPGHKYGDKPNPAFPGALYRDRAGSRISAVGLSNTCSYMYAPWLNLQTHPDTVIMADAPVADSGYGYGWRLRIRNDNHDKKKGDRLLFQKTYSIEKSSLSPFILQG